MTLEKLFLIIGAVALALTLLRYLFDKPLSPMVYFVQNFVGVLFIFSGFVKAIDPLGTSYKIEEYFVQLDPKSWGIVTKWFSFNFHMGFLEHYTLEISIITIVLEIVVGIMLLLGFMRTLTTTLLLLLILFFTFLTGYTYLSGFCPKTLFWVLTAVLGLVFVIPVLPKDDSRQNKLAYFALGFFGVVFILCKYTSVCFACAFTESSMKVTDCGCFGDFIKLHPSESFFKDILLTILILFLVVRRKFIEQTLSKNIALPVTGLAVVGFTLFCFYNFMWNEPVIDFRPYKIGNNLRELVIEIPKKIDYPNSTWIYKNKATGEDRAFMLKEIDASVKDTTKWTFVKDNLIIIDPGVPAKIKTFDIYDDNGDDIGESILESSAYQFLVIAYDLDKTYAEAFKKKLNPIAEACGKEGIPFFGVTSSSSKKREDFRHENQTAYPFYEADGTFLKTILRSNPGLLLLKDGKVVGKWHHRHIPTFEELKRDYLK